MPLDERRNRVVAEWHLTEYDDGELSIVRKGAGIARASAEETISLWTKLGCYMLPAARPTILRLGARMFGAQAKRS